MQNVPSGYSVSGRDLKWPWFQNVSEALPFDAVILGHGYR
jgi:hypothetical protein